MRPSSLAAHRDKDGVERFHVTSPAAFTLDEAALAMHAVVDATLGAPGTRARVGKSRVPPVLRQVARSGWPSNFVPDAGRVAFWRAWLLEQHVFTDEEGPMSSELETGFPPDEAYRVSLINQKGGVGKTALTQGTAGALAQRGRNVLLVDLDPQGHLTTEALALDDADPDSPNLARALIGESDSTVQDIITHHSKYPSGGSIDVIPTSVDMFLVIKQMYQGRGRVLEWRLHRILDGLEPGQYDHVLIDCPPALDILTDNALVASHAVLIPVQLAKTSVRALRLLFDQIAVMESELNIERRELLGMVPSLYRRPLSGYAEYVAGSIEAFSAPDDPSVPALPVLGHLPLTAAVEEAWMEGLPMVDYAPRSVQAEAHRRIATRIDVAAGRAPASEWSALEPLESLTKRRGS